MDRDGLITIQSQYTPKDTMQRLEAGLKAKGIVVFAHTTMRLAPPRLVWPCAAQTS
jgi:uncharacterized protein (DUF302 family)